MQPEPERIDLAVLDVPDFERGVARVAARAAELRRLRRVVATRGMTALVLVAAAALLFWLSIPKRTPREVDALVWMTPDAKPEDVLRLGGDYAQ